MIEINGSYLEGGGQIVRTAIALSAVTGKPFRVTNIRQGRKKTGLKAQHLTALQVAQQMCSAKVSGAKLGSDFLEFSPGQIKHGKYKADIGTAGSVTLLLQTLIPIAAFAKDTTTIELIGGTDVAWSMTVDYFKHVFCDYMSQLGLDVKLEILQRGMYPKGGGRVKVIVKPWKKKKSFTYTNPGKKRYTDITSVATTDLQKARVAERQIDGFEKEFGQVRKKNKIYVKALSIGSSVHAHTHFEHAKLGVCILGERGKRAEKVGSDAAKILKKEIASKATIDQRMADQIIPYLAFTGGRFKTSRISKHLKTNIWTVEQFLGKKFKINETAKIVSTI